MESISSAIIKLCSYSHVLIVPLIFTLTGIENSQERKFSTQGASTDDVNLLLYSVLSLRTLKKFFFCQNQNELLVTSPLIF